MTSDGESAQAFKVHKVKYKDSLLIIVLAVLRKTNSNLQCSKEGWKSQQNKLTKKEFQISRRGAYGKSLLVYLNLERFFFPQS